MRKALTAMAMLAGALVLLAAAASARSTSREHVTIDQKGGSFVLTPAGGGALKADRGAFAACCWTQRFVYIAGQRVEVDNPKLTLTGANGTLTLRNRIQWVDVPGGLSRSGALLRLPRHGIGGMPGARRRRVPGRRAAGSSTQRTFA